MTMACTSLARGSSIGVFILPWIAANKTNITLSTTTATNQTEITTLMSTDFTSTTIVNTSTNTSTSVTSTECPKPIIDLIKPYVIIAGVVVLILLLIVSVISSIQRRREQHLIQNYLLSLHSLLPFLRNYDDIPNFDETHGGIKKSKHSHLGNHIEEYDEIEMVARRSKLSEVKESKHDCETDQSTNMEASQDRNTVYSLQKEILSSNL